MMSERKDYELTVEEIRQVNVHNKKHQLRSPEMDLVPRYFMGSERGNPDTYALTANDVKEIIERFGKSSNKLNFVNIGKALTSMGLEKKSIRLPRLNYPTSCYFLTSPKKEILDFLRNDPDYLTT